MTSFYKILFMSISLTITALNAVEKRAFISDSTTTKDCLVSMNAIYKGNYSFKDHIYFPKETCSKASYARIRVYKKSEWIHKPIVLTIKSDDQSVLLKEEYDTIEDAQKKLSPDFTYAFQFFREGWEYALNGCALFVEDIENLDPSLEIVAPTEQAIEKIFKAVHAEKLFTTSIPIFYKLFKESMH